MSPAKIDLFFSSGAEAGFYTDTDQLDFTFSYSLGTTQAEFDLTGGGSADALTTATLTEESVGTKAVNIDVSSGEFDIVTGDAGVAATINDSTFAALIRTTGYLKAWTSI